jgi:hypothetical protein
MYEHRQQPILPRPRFVKRVVLHVAMALLTVVIALAIGTIGHHSLGKLDWVDALLNAAMILGGMGPIDPLPSTPAKLFAAAYALFSGLLFIGILGVVLAPFAHRLLHSLHVDTAE